MGSGNVFNRPGTVGGALFSVGACGARESISGTRESKFFPFGRMLGMLTELSEPVVMTSRCQSTAALFS